MVRFEGAAPLGAGPRRIGAQATASSAEKAAPAQKTASASEVSHQFQFGVTS
jgi:hypothetical protein